MICLSGYFKLIILLSLLFYKRYLLQTPDKFKESETTQLWQHTWWMLEWLKLLRKEDKLKVLDTVHLILCLIRDLWTAWYHQIGVKTIQEILHSLILLEIFFRRLAMHIPNKFDILGQIVYSIVQNKPKGM